MRILLLQDHLHLPSYGGGIKANRLLLEALAGRGHSCAAVSPALASRAGPADEEEFRAEMVARGIEVDDRDEFAFRYHHRGVEVDALRFMGRDGDREDLQQRAHDHIERRVGELEPDWVLVNDDRFGALLRTALEVAGAERIVLVLQTVTCTPFGPLAYVVSPARAERMRQVAGVAVISRFLQRYIAEHGDVDSKLVPLPVYGDGPFPLSAHADGEFVTLINPCAIKGLDVLLGLAEALPDVSFAAVPGWGTDEEVLQRIRSRPNVRVLDSTDDIDEIFARTRVLLAPSLLPETFGYVVPEAMLRGIPVLAADLGGLPEAGLGAATLLPVVPLERRGDAFVSHPQHIDPWVSALGRLLADRGYYQERSELAREAALSYVSRVDAGQFEGFLATRKVHA